MKDEHLAACTGCGHLHTFMGGSLLTWERVQG